MTDHAFDADKRARLRDIIRARSYSEGVDVKLASGRSSNRYFDMKITMLHPESAYLIGCALGDACDEIGARHAGGLEMGAVPLATALAAVSHLQGAPVTTFFVRKQVKEHGSQRAIEGLAPGESLDGQRVAVLEDVTTTGGSAIKAVDQLRAAGGIVSHLVTLVDREEGAEDACAEAGLTLLPIYRASEFGTG